MPSIAIPDSEKDRLKIDDSLFGQNKPWRPVSYDLPITKDHANKKIQDLKLSTKVDGKLFTLNIVPDLTFDVPFAENKTNFSGTGFQEPNRETIPNLSKQIGAFGKSDPMTRITVSATILFVLWKLS